MSEEVKITYVDQCSVRVMRSHDYCHFEIILGLAHDPGQFVKLETVDALRKEAARMADKAVAQYQRKKAAIQKAEQAGWGVNNLKEEADAIKAKPEADRTPEEQATLKEFLQYCYAASLDYDYED